MVKADMESRLRAVLLSIEGVQSDQAICSSLGVSDRTLRRWKRAYRIGGQEGLKPNPTTPRNLANKTDASVVERILQLKQKYPTWGARRLKYQFNLPVAWCTVHRILKKSGLLIRIKPKPQPCKRFQRKHVDSLWQGDTFQFRIRDVGKVYVTGFTDDRSRYRIKSKAYLHKGKEESINALSWAVRAGRIPKQIYLDNGKQFIAKEFKEEAKRFGIKLIYGRPHHPRGRGKIESYHRALYRELIRLKEFDSLSHFKKELQSFDKRYNHWRKQEALGWQTPASVYFDKKYFNKNMRLLNKRTHVLTTKTDKC